MEEQEPGNGESVPGLGELRRENDVLKQQVAEYTGVVSRLEQSVADRDAELAALRETGAALQQESAGLAVQLAEAVKAYRDLVVQAEPGLPVEMVADGSIIEIQESVTRARAVVEQVRRELDAENARQRVPAGAPPRSAPDVSALSAREKIRFVLGDKTE